MNYQILEYLLSQNVVNKFNFIIFVDFCVNVGLSKILKEVELYVTRQYRSLKEDFSKLNHLRPLHLHFAVIIVKLKTKFDI